MSKITIIQADGVVGINGEFREVDLSDLDTRIHAVQYDDVAGVGHIEFDASLDPRLPNQPLGKMLFEKLFNRFLKRWRAAGEPPPRTPEQIAADDAAQAQAAKDTQAAASAKADPVITYLVSHTPAECAQYVRDQVNASAITTQADAKAAIIKLEDIQARMAMALSVIARHTLR